MKKLIILIFLMSSIIVLKATNWSIQLEIMDSESQDIDNHFGVHQNALDSHDSLDAFEPPSPPPPFVKLYFPHQDWGGWNGNYTNDIKSDFITNKYWFVNIQSSSPSQQSYTLQWNSLDEVPDYYNLILQNGFDMIDMREQNEYQFSSSSNTISIMTMARPINGYPYISEQIDSLYFEDYTPQQFELNDYFSVNGSSSLSYQFLENLELAQSIEGSIYTISPIPGWSGNSTIYLTAIGSEGEVTMQIKITGNKMNPPENVQVSHDGINVNITWDPVINAISYKLLSCDTPDGTFEEDTTGIFNGESWTKPETSIKKFYKIIAIQ